MPLFGDRRGRALRPFIFAFLLFTACNGGSEHRPPTIIAGNVRSVAPAATARRPFDRLIAWWRAEAVAQVPGIVVAIENSTTVATSDSDGFFRLEGNQFGPSVLHFTGEGADAQLPLKLPSGGEIDLIDVDLSGAEITVAQQQIHLDGPITGVDCGQNLLQVLSGERVPFRLHLQPGTSIVDDNGLQLPCGDLETGQQADVRGTLDSRGDVDPSSIRVGEEPTATPTPGTTATPATTPRPTGTPP